MLGRFQHCKPRHWLLSWCLCLTLAVAPRLHAEAANEIAWTKSGIPAALKEARAQQRPVLLYWGAQWCPPCNQLKATVFKSPAFIEKTRHFAAIYLDGDGEEAQQLGEQFKVVGYPTLVVLDAEGQEVTRIPGGMELDIYPRVLDLALRQVKPVATLLSAIIDQGQKPSAEEIRLLAYYSWDQDSGQAMRGREPIPTLLKLSSITPAELANEQRRFDAAAISAFSAMPEDKRARFQPTILEKTRALVSAAELAQNADPFLLYEAPEALKAFGKQDPAVQVELAGLLINNLNSALKQSGLSPQLKLMLLDGLVRSQKLAGVETTEAQRQEIRQLVQQARAAADNPYALVTATYDGYSALDHSGQQTEALALMQQALSEDTNSTYWMLLLADIAEQQNQPLEALRWYQQAYAQTPGPASKLQWGSYTLRYLTQAQPLDTGGIQQFASELIDLGSRQAHGFHGRNVAAYQRMAKAMKSWAVFDDQQQAFAHWQTALEEACRAQEPGEQGERHCRSMLGDN